MTIRKVDGPTVHNDAKRHIARALSAAARAMGRHPDCAVTFEDDGDENQNILRLAALPTTIDAEGLAKIRGAADSFALRLRYHDPRLHRRWRPADDRAGDLFDALETIRFESLGARALRGAALNLAALADGRAVRLPPSSRAVVDAARVALAAAPDHVLDVTATATVSDPLSNAIAGLIPTIADQEAFARVGATVIAATGLDPTPGAFNADSESDSEARATKDEAGDAAKADTDMVRTAPQDSQAGPEDSDASAKGDSLPDTMPEGGGEDPGGLQKRPVWLARSAAGRDYAIFTGDFDRVCRAEDLCPPGDWAALRRALERRLTAVRAASARHAGRLGRAILARVERSWEVDLDEGHLDTRRLDRVVTTPLRPHAFRKSLAAPFRDTAVALLIDNSGSMRGELIEVAAASADILGTVLQRCDVTFEILGFTTREWKGGRSHARWRRAGSPPRPGRLNETLHVVYKAAADPWWRTRRNLALMLRENLLKENIDGEALLWAYHRLIARPEKRRILVVLSDGEPVDNATNEANGDDYLARHLHRVVAEITASPVELYAVGIGHDVGQFYPAALSVDAANNLAIGLLEGMTALFLDGPDASRGHALGATADAAGRKPPDTPLAILGDGARFAPIGGEYFPAGAIRH